MTTPRELHTATLLAEGMVLVAGGDSGGNALATAELYNPTNQQWTPITNSTMSSGREFHTATALNNGVVLVAGGTDSTAWRDGLTLGTQTITRDFARPCALKAEETNGTNGTVRWDFRDFAGAMKHRGQRRHTFSRVRASASPGAGRPNSLAVTRASATT
jgi:hypothetical protein